MTLNHFTGVYLFRFPVVPVIFTLLCISGYFHTRNLDQYKKRLFLIALITHLPHKMYLGLDFLNIVFTFLVLIFAIEMIDSAHLFAQKILIVTVFVVGSLFLPLEANHIVMPMGIAFFLIWDKMFPRIKWLLDIRIRAYWLRYYYPVHFVVLIVLRGMLA